MFENDESTEQIRTAYEQAFPELPPEHARSLVDHVATEPGEPMSDRDFLEHMKRGTVFPAWVGYHAVRDKSLQGGEFLARILTEDGFVCAERFKAAASRLRMWPEISKRTIETGMQVTKHIPPDLTVSFNAGGDLLDDPHFAEYLHAVRELHGAQARTICLETVESMKSLLINGRSVTLKKCAAGGFGILADDIGGKEYDRGVTKPTEGDSTSQNSEKLLSELARLMGEIHGIKFCGAVTSETRRSSERIRKCIEKGKKLGVHRFIAEGSEDYPIDKTTFRKMQTVQDEYGDRIELSVQGPVFQV